MQTFLGDHPFVRWLAASSNRMVRFDVDKSGAFSLAELQHAAAAWLQHRSAELHLAEVPKYELGEGWLVELHDLEHEFSNLTDKHSGLVTDSQAQHPTNAAVAPDQCSSSTQPMQQ